MQPEPAAKTSNPRRKFFFVGALCELLLIGCCMLPDSWLAVEARNFAIVTHTPLLLIAEGFGLAGIFILIGGFIVMAWLWGLLIRLTLAGIHRVLGRFSVKQRSFVWAAVAISGLVGLVMLVISALPQTPRPFISTPEIRSVVAANNAFALDLYQKLKDQPGNLFFSPFSISTALAMTCPNVWSVAPAEDKAFVTDSRGGRVLVFQPRAGVGQ